VLHAAALIGSVVEPWLLERAADCPPSLVDELADRGLLTADGAVLRFRHEIARRAVAQEIPAHRQPAIHARLLAALLAAGCTEDARLAFHAEAPGGTPPSSGRTGRRPRSSSGRCASRTANRPPSWPAGTTPWPASCR
jgi:hypothetical protein